MIGVTSLLNERNLIIIGRRFGSDAVAMEAAEAAARWRRDEAALSSYGFGAVLRAKFEEDRAKHEALRVSRSQVVATKRQSYTARNTQMAEAWAWVDRVTSTLRAQSLTDDKLATALEEATPDDEAGLEIGIQALAVLLTNVKDRLPADAQASERLAEAGRIVTELASSPGLVHTNSSRTLVDTEQIDLLDGKLCVWIRELNKAGRRAVRNGHLQAVAQDYVFHHLSHSGRPASAHPAPAPVQAPGA